jgi:hypothetical protein
MDGQILPVINNYQIMAVAFVVSEENIFTMRGFDIAPIFHGFFDGWQWRVFVYFVQNAKPIECLKNFFAYFVHQAKI